LRNPQKTSHASPARHSLSVSLQSVANRSIGTSLLGFARPFADFDNHSLGYRESASQILCANSLKDDWDPLVELYMIMVSNASPFGSERDQLMGYLVSRKDSSPRCALHQLHLTVESPAPIELNCIKDALASWNLGVWDRLPEGLSRLLRVFKDVLTSLRQFNLLYWSELPHYSAWVISRIATHLKS